MISYAQKANKQLVIALTTELRRRGYEVWRDEDGSALVGIMSGETGNAMADAVESSYAVIVCISPEYKQSIDCRMQAKYANDLFKRGKLKLLYCCMNASYTTLSQPECVDGWLGFMIGDALWYPLWDQECLDSTATALAKSIGDHGSR